MITMDTVEYILKKIRKVAFWMIIVGIFLIGVADVIEKIIKIIN